MSTDTFLGTDWHGSIFTGAWSPGGGETYPVVEPATGQTLAEIGAASADDVYAAAARAASAQKQWARTTPAEKAAVLRRAGDLWAEHAAEIGEWIVRESGAIQPKADLETTMAAQICYESAS
ncbi:aldehyde dehydrogenase family protein, partial [Mycobacterium tuberculosis]|nr:aldehyde dehydrogenase family protein [Mycobacterium tuberculosis]